MVLPCTAGLMVHWISQSAKSAVGGGWTATTRANQKLKRQTLKLRTLDEEMDVDSEEEGHRSDIELSLSDSD